MQPLAAEARSIVLAEVRRHGNDLLAVAIERGDFRLLGTEEAVWLAPSSLHEFLRAQPKPEAATVGEPWGEVKRGRWKPSLAALLRVGCKGNAGRAVLREAAVQPFLYGRPVLRKSLRQIDGSLGSGDHVWVCDPHGEVLGVARILPPGRGEEVLEAMVDLGWYLREGG